MKAKDVIITIAKDFESFFTIDYNVKLDFSDHYILSIKGSGNKTRIKVPNKFSNGEVKNDKDLIYIALLMGHELAHHIHKHNSYIASTKEENKAIENWADYFGISITLTLLLYNTNFSKYLQDTYSSNEEYITLVLSVFDKLYLEVYKDSGTKYESAEYRLNTVFTGIISWIAKVELTRNAFSMSPKDPEEIYRDYSFHWHLKLYKIIEKNKNSMLYNVLIYMHAIDNIDKLKEKTALNLKIHKKISDNQMAISSGLKLQFAEILNTSFGKNNNQGKLHELLDELGIEY